MVDKTAAAEVTSYEATGHVRAGGEGHLEPHGLAAPFDATAGRLDTLPGPADILCAALCACILKNVERFSQMLHIPYVSASVVVRAERESPPPRIVRMHYRIDITSDAPQARVELLHKNIRQFGTITNTLGAACEISGELNQLRSAEVAS